MVGGYRLFTAAIAQSDAAADLEQDWLGNRPKAEYRSAAADVLTAGQDPGSLERPLAISIGVVPGQLGALIHLTDAIVHAIDLAVSTRQEHLIDEDAAQQLLSTMQSMEMMDRFRVPDVFRPEVSAAPAAAAHRRLMAFLGRPANNQHLPSRANSI